MGEATRPDIWNSWISAVNFDHHIRIINDIVDKSTDKCGCRVRRGDQDCQNFSVDVLESYEVAIRALGLHEP